MRKFMTAVFVLLASAGAAFAADDWQNGAGSDWQKTLAEARHEGKVTVTGMGLLAEPLPAAFKRDTGIDLDYLPGPASDTAARFMREVEAGHPTIDISLGGGQEVALIKKEGLTPVKAQFMLSGVTQSSNWVDGHPLWFDTAQEYMFQGSNWVFGQPLVNAKLLKPEDVRSWQDLLKPEFKGKIAADDPRVPGPGQAEAAYIASTFGIEFLKKLYIGQNVTLTRDSRQLVEWVARGVHPIALGALPVIIERFRSQGFKELTVVSPTDGPGTVLGGFSVLKEAKDAPHPAAARVFINWYASQPGQQTYTRTMMEPSTRTDVKESNIPDYIIPKPGVKYLNQYQEAWYVQERPKLQAAIIEAMGGR
jgi:ABC-type Fe3+ transport system substrate-binding protein